MIQYQNRFCSFLIRLSTCRVSKISIRPTHATRMKNLSAFISCLSTCNRSISNFFQHFTIILKLAYEHLVLKWKRFRLSCFLKRNKHHGYRFQCPHFDHQNRVHLLDLLKYRSASHACLASQPFCIRSKQYAQRCSHYDPMYLIFNRVPRVE